MTLGSKILENGWGRAPLYSAAESRGRTTSDATQLEFYETVVERISACASLDEAVDVIMQASQPLLTPSLPLVSLADYAEGKPRHLRIIGSAPSISGFVNEMNHAAIVAGNGGCAAAILSAEPVIAADVLTDPVWTNLRRLPLEHGIVSTWSFPLIDPRNAEVLGALAIVSEIPRVPSRGLLRSIQRITRTLVLAIVMHGVSDRQRRLDAELTATVARLPVMAWLADANGAFRVFSKGWRDYTGAGEEGADQRITPLGLPAEDAQHLRAAFAAARAEGQPFHCEHRLRRSDGVERWVVNHGVPRLARDGTIAGYVGVVTDIDDRHATAEQLRVTRDQAEAASAAKSAFLANMSHELRTPLNAVIGFAEFMADEPHGPMHPRYREYIDDVRRSGEHLLSLIDDVLDFSKADAGRLTLQPTPLDLGTLVEDCVRLLSPRAHGGHIHIESTIPIDRETVFADRRRLKQILLNLLTNAVKFTQPGGEITISAEVAGADMMEISVADTGIGIAPENIEAVLQPFVQVQDVFTRCQEGSGLGLPLCRRLAELHGGSLSIESALGHGTTVRVRLPRPTPQALVHGIITQAVNAAGGASVPTQMSLAGS